ncbi:type II secretion system protein GspK [Lichenifustis flavocetrariae]|uniref:General secretion pathway protein GspK n=1 Tax=Lichenifustis flavocetrariae TaxID=2949735 RepID=A0AA42CMX8_9HYPH|nr:type II secretion system protein GspK [Lichenifustis flavocetrariae]MCW6508825.1 general secretion pathway protein GspK [Lichenifustis flavocetrariae]
MKRRATSDGYVLVAVLSVLLVLAGLIASSSLVAQSALRSARVDADRTSLDGLLRGGLEMTAYQLFTLKLPAALVTGRPLRFGEGSVVPRLTDEGGKIDVNASASAVLAGAFREAGVEASRAAELAARITALRGSAPADNAGFAPPDAVSPAPATGSGTPPSPSGPRRTGFRSVADFIAFTGVDHEEAAALNGMLTVANPDGKVDVLTASRHILMALPDMSDALADSLIADRGASTSDDAGRLKGTLDRQLDFIKFEPGPCYSVKLDARSASGHMASAGAVIAAAKTPDEPFYILQWE